MRERKGMKRQKGGKKEAGLRSKKRIFSFSSSPSLFFRPFQEKRGESLKKRRKSHARDLLHVRSSL